MTTDTRTRLPSWRPGATRDAVVAFLDQAVELPVAERVAIFDNDGTLWCERPGYVQFEFFVDALATRVAQDPALADRAELAAVLSGDPAAIGAVGLERIVFALAGLFEGEPPERFATEVRTFMEAARHGELDRPMRAIVYQPMLELLDELRRLEFTIGIATGGGTEFVRAISGELYGVPPERVVGTLIGYDLDRDDAGLPLLRRRSTLVGDVNEGAAKVTNIQTQFGRRPVLAAGNSAGDREMLEWASTARPWLALLVDHDDAEREYSYVSSAATFAEDEPILDVAARLGWTVVSIADDWETVFPADG